MGIVAKVFKVFRTPLRIIQFAISYLTPKLPDIPNTKIDTKNPLNSVPVCYGKNFMQGNFVFVQTESGNVANLDVVLVLAEGECSAQTGRTWINDKLITHDDIKNLVSMQTYNGSDTQTASSLLISRQPSYWSSAHRLRGLSYRILRYNYHDKYMSGGNPSAKFEVYGKLCQDPRQSNNEFYTENPILHIYDFFQNKIFGMRLSQSQINLTVISDLADLCDSIGADNRPLFRSSLVINPSRSREQNLQQLLKAFRGSIYQEDDKIVLSMTRSQPVSLQISDSDIISMSVNQSPADSIFNSGTLTYRDEDSESKSCVYTNTAALIEDSNIVSTFNGSVSHLHTYDQAMDYLTHSVDQSRLSLFAEMTTSMVGFRCTQNDVIEVSSGEYAFVAKQFIVEEIVLLTEKLEVKLSLREYDAQLFVQKTHAQNTDNNPNYTFNDQTQLDAPSSLVLLSNDSINSVTNKNESALIFSWDQVNNGYNVNGYETQFKLSSSVLWTAASNVTNSNVQITYPLRSGETYDFRVRTLAHGGRISSLWTTINNQVYLPTSVPSPPQNPGPITLVGENSTNIFYGLDANIKWDWLSNSGVALLGTQAGSSPAQAFILQVLNPAGSLLREERLFSNSYSYTQSMNISDQKQLGNLEGPLRQFSFRLWQRDTYGQSSSGYSQLSVSNPHPSESDISFALSSGNKIIKVTLTQPSLERDLSHYEIFLSTSADPPLAATLFGKIFPNETTHLLRYHGQNQLVNGQLYHVQIVPVDIFSPADYTNTTGIQTVTPLESNSFPDERQSFQEISLGSSTFRDTGMQVKRNPFNNGLPGLFLGDHGKQQFIDFSDETGDAKFTIGDNVILQNGYNRKLDSIYNNWDQNLSNISEDVLTNAGAFTFEDGYCNLQNGLNSGDLRSHYKQLFGVPVSWANSRRVRFVVKPAQSGTGTENAFVFITGRQIQLSNNGFGVFFGFRYYNSGDLRAVYNNGQTVNTYESATLSTINTLNTYKLEAHSDVVNGTIKWYLDDVEIHSVNVNTASEFVPGVYDERMWQIAVYHGANSSGPQETLLTSIEFQQISNS